MNILLIGGTGFLGSILAEKLIARNHQLTIITRDPSKPVSFDSSKVTMLKGDLTDADSLNVTGRFDILVYTAMVPFKPGRVSGKKFMYLQNILRQYFKNTINLAEKLSCPLLLTSGVSFETTGGQVADESWPITRKGMAELGKPYDELVEKIREEGKIPLIELLPGQIYGNGGMFSKMIDMAKSGRVVILGNGNNCIPKIHVDDCAEAYVLAIEKLPVGKRYIVADDVSVTVDEFMHSLARMFEAKRILRIPKFLLRIVVGKYIYPTLTMNTIVSNALIKKELGWNPRYPTYREGLKQITHEPEQSVS